MWKLSLSFLHYTVIKKNIQYYVPNTLTPLKFYKVITSAYAMISVSYCEYFSHTIYFEFHYQLIFCPSWSSDSLFPVVCSDGLVSEKYEQMHE